MIFLLTKGHALQKPYVRRPLDSGLPLLRGLLEGGAALRLQPAAE